jgi:Kef-type K+ transport system membrane component KefB
LLTSSAVTAPDQGDDYGVLISRCCGLDVHQATVVVCLLTGEPGSLPRIQVKTFSAATEGLMQIHSTYSFTCKPLYSAAVRRHWKVDLLVSHTRTILLMMYKTILRYVVILVFLGAGTISIIMIGTNLHSGRATWEKVKQPSALPTNIRSEKTESSTSIGIGRELRDNLRHPMSILLLQVIVILLAARIIGALLPQKARQPTVIGEMIAGILLGPSLLGWLSHPAMTFLFPPQSMESLQLFSQIGVVIFMFVVGTEVNTRHIYQNVQAAVLISHASILAPFFLGAVLALIIYPSAAPVHVGFTEFALFISVAMSITAFPVLARIIEERGLSHLNLGNIAIACAAVDDMTAWCLLAVVIAIVKASGIGSAVLTIFLTVLFIGLMLFVLKRQADRLIHAYQGGETQRRKLASIILILSFASAFFTEVIGIHALFGAFLAGVIVPSNSGLRKFMTERLEILTSCFLLPLFFAFTGLRTQIGLLNNWPDWFMCAGVIAVAIAGKFGGSTLAARWSGMNWHDSLSLGVLMNARGLIEVVVLNVGYDLGVLSPRIFSIMVIMALVTTFMTAPLLSLLESWKRKELSTQATVLGSIRS